MTAQANRLAQPAAAAMKATTTAPARPQGGNSSAALTQPTANRHRSARPSI